MYRNSASQVQHSIRLMTEPTKATHAQDARPMIIWCSPRTLSHAFERMIRARNDFDTVLAEPFNGNSPRLISLPYQRTTYASKTRHTPPANQNPKSTAHKNLKTNRNFATPQILGTTAPSAARIATLTIDPTAPTMRRFAPYARPRKQAVCLFATTRSTCPPNTSRSPRCKCFTARS